MDDIMASVKSIIGEFESIKEFENDIANIDENSNLQEIGFNSLDFIHFVSKVENKFNIFIEDEDLIFENFNTLAKIGTYIKENM